MRGEAATRCREARQREARVAEEADASLVEDSRGGGLGRHGGTAPQLPLRWAKVIRGKGEDIGRGK